MLNIRESWLGEMDGFLSNSILIDMLAQELSMTLTVRRGGREILQWQEKEKGRVGREDRLILTFQSHMYCD